MSVKKNTPASAVALGGILAAAALVVMGLGGMIPIATYVCPMICMLELKAVLKLCGTRMAWAWYGAVALLSLLIGPDKEAAAVFVFLGYYPIVKPWMDRQKLPWLWKGLLFNGSMVILYWMLLHLFGMAALAEEFSEFNGWMLVVLLILGNITFYLLDFVLSMRLVRRRKRK